MKKFISFSFLVSLLCFLCSCSFVDYYNPSAEITTFSKMTAELKYKIEDIVNRNIAPDMSDYEKVKAIHDYIIITTDFDKKNMEQNSIPDSCYTASGALINHVAVCQGYAEAFQLLMNAVDVECKTITGVADGENHAWNVVKIDGKWYQIDVTWDDPIINEAVVSGTDNLIYNYFLLPDSEMQKDHTPSGNTVVCDSDKYLYGQKKYDTPYVILENIEGMSNYYLNLYLQGHTSVTFYFKDNIAEIGSDLLQDTAKKLHAAGISVNGVTYTPISSQGIYHYTTITFS